uniref:Peptidase_M23 n=1 Tax=uncultured Thermoanaerobacter sp. TaxID=242695 RepID=A0A060CCK0_9THEO|nr:peptidase_M23 [uncultured Thermoanaerobacter sp.]
MVQYENSFLPNTGISLGHHSQESLMCWLAQSGEVTRVEQVPLVGTVVEITHSEGLKTVYNSLTEVAVSAGDEVKQGDVIAKAGRNEIGKDLGVHLHFEVHENDQPVNPVEFLPELD